MSRLYDGEVRSVDDMIGKVVAAIDKDVGRDRAIIVFTSDHGEAFGEHEMWEHGHTLHREVIRVPLILTAPSLTANTIVEWFVRTIDIVPTVLELVDAATELPPDLEGTSLVPFASGGGGDLPIYSEAMLYGSTERSLTAGRYKLMYDEQGGKYSLYDTTADPQELTDISSREAQATEQLRTDIIGFHEELGADFLRRNGAAPAASGEEDERSLKALRALGYINE